MALVEKDAAKKERLNALKLHLKIIASELEAIIFRCSHRTAAIKNFNKMKKIHDAVLEYCKNNRISRGIFATSDGSFILHCESVEAADKSGLRYVFKYDGSKLTLSA